MRARSLARATATSLLFGLAAHATPNPPLLLIDGNEGELVRQLRAEATALGWATDRVPGATETHDDELLAEHGARALVHVLGPERVTIHVEGGAGRSAYDATLVRNTPDEAFALEIVELIHARWLEPTGPLPDAGPPDTRAPPSTSAAQGAGAPSDRSTNSKAQPAALATRGPMLWAGGGAEALFVAGGFGVTPQATIGLRVEPVRRAWLRLYAAFPLVESTFRSSTGSADVLVRSFSTEFGYRVLEPARGLFLEAGASAGLAIVDADVDTEPPSAGHSQAGRAGLFLVHFGVSAELSSWFCVRASIAAGSSAPSPSVYVGATEVGAFGPALGVATLNAEFGWPLGNEAR